MRRIIPPAFHATTTAFRARARHFVASGWQPAARRGGVAPSRTAENPMLLTQLLAEHPEAAADIVRHTPLWWACSPA